MNAMLGLFSFLLLATCVGWLALSLARRRTEFQPPVGRWTVGLLLAGAILSGLLILRPHEDTLTGLDTSGYRLMAQALAGGRGLHGADPVLLAVPRDLRQTFMLLPSMFERNTRDRAFLVRSLDSCATEPFFYPLLPLCAVGLNLALPGSGADYLVPLTGWLFCCTLMVVAVRRGGAAGLCLAVALLFGSPLPVWLLRGFFVESVGAVLLSLAALCWLTRSAGDRLPLSAYFALGLAASFHPVLIVLALPLLLLFALDQDEPPARAWRGVFAFGAGFAVLLVMTLFICEPYGALLSGNTLKHNFEVSISHRVTIVFGAGSLLLLVAALLCKPLWRKISLAPPWGRRFLGLLIVAAAGLPLAAAGWGWSERAVFRHGLFELWTGTGWGVVLLLGLSAFVTLLRAPNLRSSMLLTVVLGTLPVFAYLKGAEQMGLWSQRRLIPSYLLLVTTLVPPAAAWLADRLRPRGLALKTLVLAAILLGGLMNPLRWPAPYVVRFDRGANRWVARMEERIGTRLCVFDYFPYSAPFSARGRTRVLGLGEAARGAWPDAMQWLAGAARTTDVRVVTAYSNPGLEDGVALVSQGRETARLPRAVSKWALPAVREDRNVDVEFLRVVAVAAPADDLVLHKILDGGPLALRGPWGRSDLTITTTGGERLPACWSREGSGFVGPVPPAGRAVRLTLAASSARGGPQTLRITPPWVSATVLLSISNELTEATAVITRAATDNVVAAATGVYQIHAVTPYNPALEGISGFKPDLGALIHSIRVETVPHPGGPL